MAKGDIAEINRFVGKTKVSKKYTKKNSIQIAIGTQKRGHLNSA